jgi:hypothetical protein
VAKPSTVLNNKRAIEMNFAIMRTFIALRKMALDYKKILQKLEKIETQYSRQFGGV